MLSVFPLKTHYKWLQLEEPIFPDLHTSVILVHAYHSLTWFPNNHVICSTSVSAEEILFLCKSSSFWCVLPFLVMGKISSHDRYSLSRSYLFCMHMHYCQNCLSLFLLSFFLFVLSEKNICILCKYLESVCQFSHGRVMLGPLRRKDVKFM